MALAVHRLTQAPAEFLGLNAGVLKPGVQADICVVDPVALKNWNPEKTYEFVYREAFTCKQVVNRPTGVVQHTMIAGNMAWNKGAFEADLGKRPFGRLMRAKDHPLELQRSAA